MATATGLTAERMLEIEARSIVHGEIVGSHLVLERHDGTPVDAGVVPGTAYVYEQDVLLASTSWEVVHGQETMGLSVKTWDSGGTEIIGDVIYVDSNTIRVEFYYPQTGKIRIWN